MIADAFQDNLNEYIEGVLSGDVVAGALVKAAVQRHVDNLARQSTAEFPYRFDYTRASKACNFYPKVLRHSIGSFAGMPLELSPWQMFIEASIFGWVRDADDLRRFRTAYESVARKNGKSTKCAGRAQLLAGYDHNPVIAAKLGKSFCPEPVAQVILAASKREQADKVIFAECLRMRRKSPSISNASKDVNKQIEFTRNEGTIETVGSDKPYDGRNPHAVFMDEIHAWREHHREFHDTMITGDGSRDQPLISYITTAGSDKSHLWKEVYQYAKDVVTGRVIDESVFAFIAELDDDDDPWDELVWEKANPNLGVSCSIDYLRAQATKMKQTEVGRNRFMRYHGNRQVSSLDAAFDLGKWDECKAVLSDWSTADAFGVGVDLGARDDLASYSIVARWQVAEEDGIPIWRYEGRTQSYIAESTKRDLTKAPFAEFVYNEHIRVCKHPLAELRSDLIADCLDLGIDKLAYDPYNGQALAEDLEAEGIEPVRMAQTYSMFNEPIEDLQETISSGYIAHDGDPLLRWAIGNAITVSDTKGHVMYDKGKSMDKIDPVVALTMGFRMAKREPTSTGSLFVG